MNHVNYVISRMHANSVHLTATHIFTIVAHPISSDCTWGRFFEVDDMDGSLYDRGADKIYDKTELILGMFCKEDSFQDAKTRHAHVLFIPFKYHYWSSHSQQSSRISVSEGILRSL